MLNDDKNRRVYGLQIDGLMTRFYFNGNPFIDSQYIDLDYTDVEAILNVSSFGSSIEISGGVVSYDPITITMGMDRMRGNNILDPHVIFGRLPKSKSVFQAQLQQDISRSDTSFYIYVDKEPPATVPAMYYIGSESFYITEIVEMNPTSWRLTCFDRKGLRQSHRILLDRTDVPIVYNQVVAWRGRLADLYVGYMNDKGEVVDKKILYRGIIERSPEINDLTTCSITLVPLTALLDNKLASRYEIGRLAKGGHYFENTTYFEYMSSLQDSATSVPIVGRGIFAVQLSSGSQYLSNLEILSKINFLGRRYDQIGNVGMAIPARFSLNIVNGKYVLKIGYAIGDNAFALPFVSDVVLYDTIKLRDDYFNETNQLNQVSLITGDTILFGDDGLGGITINTLRINSDKKLYVVYDFGKDREGAVIKTIDKSVDPYPDGSNVKSIYSLNTSFEENKTVDYEVKGIPEAFYLNGEGFILLEASLGLPTSDIGTRYTIQIKKGDVKFYIKAIYEELTGYGYKIYLDRTDPSTRNLPNLVEYIGDERYEITLATYIPKTYPSQVLLELLYSGGGGGVNGAYDKHELGANLNDTYVDRNSFINLRTASNIEEWSFGFDPKDLTLSGVLDPLLKSLGAVMVMKIIDGLPKLYLKPIGHEFDEDVVVEITDNDMIVDTPPQWSNYEDIVTQITFNYNHHLEEPQEVIVNNYEAVNRLNGETSSMTLDLYGLRSDIVGGIRQDLEVYPYLRPTFSRLFRLYGQPYRLFKFSISTGKSFYIEVGDTIKLSSNFLKGYDDTYGVSNILCIVKSIKRNLVEEGCEIECIYFDFSNPTWNAGLKVKTATAGSASLTVETNLYSTSNDLNFFNVGDVVDLVSQVDNDSKVVGKVIQSINKTTDTIVFTTNHGILSTSYYIFPTTYSNAVANHTKRCYISDLSGKLGTSNVEGYQYE